MHHWVKNLIIMYYGNNTKSHHLISPPKVRKKQWNVKKNA
jgi:hypothetical protein